MIFRLRDDRKEIEKLIAMNLMENVTDEFRETMQEHEENTGRKFYVYGLTKEGFMLFNDCGNRKIN